nr:MAG: hypothetical protein [Bacteriophage sp.]
MTHKLEDVSIDQIMVEHYLFDLNQSVKKTAKILDMDEEKVRRIHQESSRFYVAVRKDPR